MTRIPYGDGDPGVPRREIRRIQAESPPLLRRRLAFVLGKGGVGKTTVADALGYASADLGKRTVIVRISADGSADGGESGAGADPTEIEPRLFRLVVTPENAVEEYLAGQIRVRTLVDALVQSRAFRHFTQAAPGLAELVTLGKIWTLATSVDRGTRVPTWDLVVVDCPATGHGLAMLSIASNVRGLADSGPIHDQAAMIERVIVHPEATGVCLVARPEELPVTEAIEAASALAAHRVPLALVVMNGTNDSPLTATDEPVLTRASAMVGGARATLASSLAACRREIAEGAELTRLRDATPGVPLVTLPLVARRELARDDIRTLGTILRGGAAT